ncbi:MULTISPECIES: DUF1203 domain-containing protein [unclassified Rhizobium]|uniref:DUF1203 domain-containing protein n=1 Tax=unclassified Rhizobium TaxID=2613769 RepID=UPI0006F29484|nr:MULTISPECIES: DUF1203 domain-containing protein [unclassified Rhizobium]KQV34321.1 hypothetical protein ASC86_15390 [Rhizobium sp. Root1212]KRD23699.1 hypothetical protein ASE37_15380 [Rhizobium sp. Root268]
MLRYTPMPSTVAAGFRRGEPDAYGMTPEQHVSDGEGMPCRHCLKNIAAGDGYLILAYRPFPALQPYAETGPIFLHAQECATYEEEKIPPILTTSKDYLLRGYSSDDRIVYGTGAVTPMEELSTKASEILGQDEVAYVHVRSARNNCYQCRIDAA